MKYYIKKAKSVIQTEIDGLNTVKDKLDDSFVQLVDLCLKTRRDDGKIVICGVGKSGYVGRKIAATLSSTGSPAAFLHPVEAMHGDLGIVHPKDILLAFSYSGETHELLTVLPAIKRFNIPIVAVTGNPESTLANLCDLVVSASIPREACPFNQAPTTSTTCQMALGDALAMVLLDTLDFTSEDYGKFHPGGSIGLAVTLIVKDMMRQSERFAVTTGDTTVKDALVLMTRCRSGSVVIIDDNKKLCGIFTDGDLRRHIQKELNIFDHPVSEVMTENPISINENILAIEILKILETREIDDIPVVNNNDDVVGLVDIQDLAKYKLM